MPKMKSIISGLLLAGLLMTSCDKEIINIEKEPDGGGYENLDPEVRALISSFESMQLPDYISNVSYETDSRIIPVEGKTIIVTVTGSNSPWNLRAVAAYPDEGEIAFTVAVNNNSRTGITFPPNSRNDVIVWELQIQKQSGNSGVWNHLGFYVQLCRANDEMVYEIQDVEDNVVNADVESINIRLTKQGIMKADYDLLWFTVREKGSSAVLASAPYNIPMMNAKIWVPLAIQANTNADDVRTLQIYYHLNNSTEKRYLCSVIQKPAAYIAEGPKAEVADVRFTGGSYLINAVGETREMQLTVESAIANEIRVRIVPYYHSAYESNTFTPITATAYKVHPTNPALNDWRFNVSFPAARGAAYAPGSAAGGWHASYASDLKSGMNSAGSWAVEYEYDTDEWVTLKSFKQDAYYIGVKNDLLSLNRTGGNWILKTQGNWPANAVRFRAFHIDANNQPVYTPEVSVNSTSASFESWENVLPITIPVNTTGSPIIWKLEYRIDFEMNGSGTWRQWNDFRKAGTPEYSWEGVNNSFTQYHF